MDIASMIMGASIASIAWITWIALVPMTRLRELRNREAERTGPPVG